MGGKGPRAFGASLVVELTIRQNDSSYGAGIAKPYTKSTFPCAPYVHVLRPLRAVAGSAGRNYVVDFAAAPCNVRNDMVKLAALRAREKPLDRIRLLS